MIAVLLRLAAASCGDDCDYLRGITITSADELRGHIVQCDTDICGSEIIGSWAVSGLNWFYWTGSANHHGPFYERRYNFLKLDGWNHQIGDASLAYMFDGFTGDIDISGWDVSNVESMLYMFFESQVNLNISGWNVGNVKIMEAMFASSQFNSDISRWNVDNVNNFKFMFQDSSFSGDISDWKLSSSLTRDDVTNMFFNSSIASDLSSWPAFGLDVSAAKAAYGLRSDYPDGCVPGGTGSCEYRVVPREEEKEEEEKEEEDDSTIIIVAVTGGLLLVLLAFLWYRRPVRTDPSLLEA